MEKRYSLSFDKVILKQLKKAAKNNHIKQILTKMLNSIEEYGPDAGALLDSQLFIYEIKNMHPPIRLYFQHSKELNEIKIFEYEMKTSQEKQQNTIEKIKRKISEA